MQVSPPPTLYPGFYYCNLKVKKEFGGVGFGGIGWCKEGLGGIRREWVK